MDTPYIYIKDALIVNEGKSFHGGILIKDEYIHEIFLADTNPDLPENTQIINAKNKILIPGLIDDQVHFREPGMTHKGDICTESRAAVAGGITSFMEMPNTIPQTTTIKDLEEKYITGAKQSMANFSFFMGATNDNIEEIKQVNPETVCGLKIFMGSSTGDMLVDNDKSLEEIFKYSPVLIAVHCEDEDTVRRNTEKYRSQYGENIPIKFHPDIRSEEACYKSSSKAVKLANTFNSRLHLIHISTEKELSLLDNTIPVHNKRITSEVCVHHLWFSREDYETLGARIKWNPAIKETKDKDALLQGLLNDKLDIIATDHAPHTYEEKQFDKEHSNISYFKTPSGGPMVQHSLAIMFEFWRLKKISLEKIVEKMCHTPAEIFNIHNRGYIRKGFYADLVIIDQDESWDVNKENILYKCKWSPLEGQKFSSRVSHTFINGQLVFDNGKFNEDFRGQRLSFKRSGKA